MASKLLGEFNVLSRHAEEGQVSLRCHRGERTTSATSLEKLHLHSRMEAVVYATREKLLDVD